MSYDLFLRPRSGSVTRESFQQYFAERPHYKVEADQAWYQNQDTGAYFVFEYSDKTVSNALDGDHEPRYPLSFNLNYFRPSFFGTEAEPELSAFVAAFDLIVDDPQTNGMGRGDFDRQKFLTGWAAGNEFGYGAVLGQLRKQNDPKKIHTLPTAEIERIWRWNLEREKRQAEVGVDCFVPRIFLIEQEGRIRSAAVWPDGIAALLPKVDYLAVGREELAPRSFFSGAKRDIVLAEWKAAEALLAAHSSQDGEGWRLDYSSPPDDIKKFVRSLPASDKKIPGVTPDSVLNAELVAKCSPES
jgi:hypothetical protein